MASPFDTAWAGSDAALEVEMGEAVFIGGVEFTAVVPESSAAPGIAQQPRVVQSGVEFLVLISLAELAAKFAGRAVKELAGLRVRRGAFEGRVLTVRDLGGAGVELAVGPTGGR